MPAIMLRMTARREPRQGLAQKQEDRSNLEVAAENFVVEARISWKLVAPRFDR